MRTPPRPQNKKAAREVHLLERKQRQERKRADKKRQREEAKGGNDKTSRLRGDL